MSDINIGNFSDTLSRKADCDLRNIDTNKCDIVIEYQEPDPNNDYKWYRLYASGWIEQGGYLQITSPTGHTINLPITMADQSYTITYGITVPTDYSGALQVYVNSSSITTTSFFIKSPNNLPGIKWQVSGLADMTHHEILPNPTSNTARALVIQVLEGMYPVGSLYMGTQSTCPMSVFFGTWELVSNGKALWTGDGTNANTTIDAGLPNITGYINKVFAETSASTDGAFKLSDNYSQNNWAAGTVSRGWKLSIDASKSSSIYGNSDTVQPPAYVVNVWRRTA